MSGTYLVQVESKAQLGAKVWVDSVKIFHGSLYDALLGALLQMTGNVGNQTFALFGCQNVVPEAGNLQTQNMKGLFCQL